MESKWLRCVLCILLCTAFLTGCGGEKIKSEKPKSPGDFVTSYNQQIKNAADAFNVNAKYLSIGRLQTGENGTKAADFADDNISFMSEKAKGHWQYMFVMNTDLDDDEVFAVIEAAIEASGADSGEVMKGIGIQSGKSYSIPALFQNEYTARTGQGYIVQSIGISIFFTIVVR